MKLVPEIPVAQFASKKHSGMKVLLDLEAKSWQALPKFRLMVAAAVACLKCVSCPRQSMFLTLTAQACKQVSGCTLL